MNTTPKLSLLALSLVLGACVTQQSLTKALSNPENLTTLIAPKKMSAEEEKHFGREAAATLLGAAPLVRDEPLQTYVNRVGQWVALQTGRSDIEWRFGVLDTPNVNAFAAPAGYILVTRGLIERLENEAELAGVLGHEIAHVIERHHADAMKKKERSGALANIAADATEGRGNKLVAGALTNVAKGLYASGLDKGDEYEADRLGIVYATRAGYHPYGLPRVIHMYAGAAGEKGFELLFSTHPSPGERLSALDAAMGDRLARFEASGADDTTVFRKLLGGR
jgi:predicted Zn-dependent protease